MIRAPLLLACAALVLTDSGCAAGQAERQTATPTTTTPAPPPDSGDYADRPDVRAFAEAVAERHNLSRAWLQLLLSQARHVPSVARLIMPAPVDVPKNWSAYRTRFVEPVRIDGGVAFWRDNERWLAAAHERWGVPPEIVVGILGVETIYGRQMGSFRVLDALATLAFDFPTGRSDRSPFFRSELAALFVLGAREGIDLLALRGSYAGAIGMPQFMPSSWSRHAVDFDADGRIDLLRSAADSIGSIANYLANFGWRRGMPAVYQVVPPADPAGLATLLAPDIVPTFSAAQFVAHGAALPDEARRHEGLLALVELQNGGAAPTHVAGTANFYAITRYNQSSYYALAVIELGAAVARARTLDAR